MIETETADFETVAGQAPAEARAFLVVYTGDDEARRSRVIDLTDGVEITFGRSRACTVSIDSERVSRQHTRVWRAGDELWAADLGSRNGTRVNGARIEGPTRIGPGDELVIGPAVAVVGRSSRLRRARRLADAEAFEDRLEVEVDRSLRCHRPLTVAMLRVAGTTIATDAAIDRLLAASRRMDLVADYGGDELALILPEVDAGAAAVSALVEVARGPQVTLHAGIAAFPRDGDSPGALTAAARAALRRARRGGPEVAVPDPAPAAADGAAVIADPAMKRLYELVDRIADTPVTVLVRGETGTGKELVAEALHRRSGRRGGPMVKLNCASLPETLLESELFGHERGAFTGADRRKVGYFEAAAGGTLFLDEIGEMPLALQAKLLRVLERRVITRVGSTTETAVDVRLVCATHRDLEAEAHAGRFREDLFFRIGGFTLIVPPLRDRPSEIALLATHFARQFAAELGQPAPVLTAAAQAALLRHDWPGNVRELRNAVERAVVLGGPVIDAALWPDRIRDAELRAPATTASTSDMKGHLAEVERASIVAALAGAGGNQTRAATTLGISRRALIYKMEKYGLKLPPGAR
jgi:two-component system response regulator AtoC